ncbi:hypothetical protein EK21DRAFT_112263 [Setomelanomma holmii]|uniref:Uncharacterized protein n=1 Tax=Setomelanomma holmii TaxID=210430 RepID=A0A9P4HBN1_9PLEO|nr:hypothetical protein EK21DRAFT_112263 [Setomelanomma holmii]
MAGKTTPKKRSRASKPYEDKSKMKPWWDIFVAKFLETPLFNSGNKVVDFTDLNNWIQEGERGGKRKFLAARTDPKYDTDLDFHAWLVFWLVEENHLDREGISYNRNTEIRDKTTMYKNAHNYVVWAKRQRQRDLKAAATKKSPKNAKKSTAKVAVVPDTDSSDDGADNLDEMKGTAMVRWVDGLPDGLDVSGQDRIEFKPFCRYNLLEFWSDVDKRFELSKYKQRRVWLAPKDGSTFAEALKKANDTDKTTLFTLKTAPADIEEEAEHVPET